MTGFRIEPADCAVDAATLNGEKRERVLASIPISNER
jgi:hypothetical protein